MKVSDLTPGDTIESGAFIGTFIGRMEHPLWPDLQLVTWRLDDGMISIGAMDLDREVGEKIAEGTDSLRKALGID